MKVLLSAYACEPGIGSEPEVGLQTALIAARHHEVWLLTRKNHADRLRTALNADPHGRRIRVCPIERPGITLAIKRNLGLVGTHAYYSAWQREAARVARNLNREVEFDLAHHATFASYWSPVGVAELDIPLVWGPVGGGLCAPWRLAPEMGLHGVAGSALRATTRPMFAWRARSARERASIVLVQNEETALRLSGRTKAEIRVVPNALVAEAALKDPGRERVSSNEVVVVGRLIPLKAGRLALRCLREMRNASARLVFLGDGPERARIERTARFWKLGDRVELVGRLPRERLLARVRGAGALLHTALHEEGGLAVAEALSVGTPVVALDHGGPAALVALWPGAPATLVRPAGRDATAQECAAVLDHYLALGERGREARTVAPSISFEEALMSAYEAAARRYRREEADRVEGFAERTTALAGCDPALQ